MEKNNKRRMWQVGRDHVGNAVLEWNSKTLRAERVEIYEEPDPDPLSKTYNLLKYLDCPTLALDEPVEFEEGRNPYDTRGPQ